MEDSDKERRIISPGDFLKGQDIEANRHKFTKAIISFMSLGEMAGKFGGEYSKSPIFSHTSEPFLVRGDGAILIGKVYGGPFCSIILEELAFFGIKHVVGYGFSGTLDSSVPPGNIMVAESGICSDGTSKEYSSDTEVLADRDMLASITDIAKGYGIELKPGKVWTTDALYREYPSKIVSWQSAGARFCNLETSPFYVVSRAIGVRAIYISVVSDDVTGRKWSGWKSDLAKVTEAMWNISLDMIDSL